MEILENYDLTKLNTFGIHAKGKFFVEIAKESDISELFRMPIFKDNKKLFLGGGSNILLSQDFDGLVVLNKLGGVEIINEDDKSVLIRSMSGVVWHDLVTFAVDRGYWGIENLSLIPGTVGGAPMQNIGAYGMEIKSIIEQVEAYSTETGEKKIFENQECKFGYRDSVFKNELKDKYFISAIVMKLSKEDNRNVTYKVLKEHLEKNNIEVICSKDISEAVADIRRSKLPDPKVIGNAGSFFKNVFVSKDQLERLLKENPAMPYFEEGGIIKVPAGWLIEQCGWKGKQIGAVGVHDKQALVLVNHGGATGEEVKNLAQDIIISVFTKFGLRLSPEVNLI
ncbi:MAG: UDP-N-acetylmuramate dehydrogenase [Candidatus Pacebacteria bacterium]|nr:UDP-N-acetylmuramate dehydrogenase [Candidatus Paceibacterota bacterium]